VASKIVIPDLPHILIDVLSAMECYRLSYVLYRDPTSDRRLVILVGGPSNVAVVEAALGTAAAKQPSGDGHEFIVRATDPDRLTSSYVLQFRFMSPESNVVNLLWLAALDEGAKAARDTVRRSAS
jgi:hypothetical protein